MDKDLEMVIGFISFIAFVIGIMILISPLIFAFSNWIVKVDPNITGIGLMIIGIMGMYFIIKTRD